MKKILFLLSLFIVTPIFLKVIPTSAFANPHCITFKVKIKATNYPGGTLQIGCPGDRGATCTGQIKDIRVGASKAVVLGKCSCFPNKNGCLTVGKKLVKNPINANGKITIKVKTPIPPKCKITTPKYCGSNGDVVNANVKLKCTKTVLTSTPTPVKTGTPTPGQCVTPEAVPNVRVSCPTCFNLSATPTSTPLDEAAIDVGGTSQ